MEQSSQKKIETTAFEIPSRLSVSTLLRACINEVLLPRFRNLEQHHIHRKGTDSLVTEADFEAERFLEQGLHNILPNSITIGEEKIANDKKRLQELLLTRNNLPVWLVDPLDGTRNFVKGSNIFCSMIALVRHQRVCASWIYAHSEQCILHARKKDANGEDANEEDESNESNVFVDDTPLESPLPVPVPPLSPSSPSSSAPPRDTVCERIAGRISWTEHPLPYDERRIERLPSVRCAGQDFVDLARGRTAFSYYNSLWPWDHAAGGFLLESTGGHLAETATGRPPSPFVRSAALLATTRGVDWEALQNMLKGRTKGKS